jgi:hypothetical protein
MQLGNNTVTSGNSNMYGYNVGTGEVFKANPTASVLIDLGAGAANSLMRVEYDSSADTIKIFDDGVEIFPAATGVSNTVGLTGHSSLHFGCAPFGSGTVITATFQGLSGTPTTGFKELTTANLPDPTIADPSAYFDTLIWSGDSSNKNITGLDFTPDFLWIKQRNSAFSVGHQLYDVVRGAGSENELDSSSTAAEGAGNTDVYGYPSAFVSGGFTATAGSSGDWDYVNKSGVTYVAWNWLADNTTGSSNTDGSITSTVSANTTSGVSIVSYTGTGSAATVGHGLGVAPSMIIAKNRSVTSNWSGYHVELGATKTINLNETAAAQTSSGNWNNTEPTTSVFSVNTATGTNGSGNSIVAYCFAEVEGFSKFGSYTGNGSTDGAFIYTGFKPAFVIYKRTNATESWEMYDTTRLTYNPYNANLKANLSNAESNDLRLDILSNGFKARSSNTAINASGSTYIYMAFAESPFKTATAR